MAGNHDYLKKGSYYLSASWPENVTGLFGQTCERVDFPKIFPVCVRVQLLQP